MPDYFDSGFCVRTPSWHGKEVLLATAPVDWDEARLAAGLMWEPRLMQTFQAPVTVKCNITDDPSEILANFPEGSQLLSLDFAEFTATVLPAIPSHRTVERDDNGHVLGVVGKGYVPVTHAVMGEVMEALMEVEPNLKYDSVGAAKEGALVWVVAYLDEPRIIAGDDSPTLPYINLQNSHDYSSPFKLTKTNVRIVCANTYDMASMEAKRSGNNFTFRHTATINERIDAAKDALRGVREEAAAWQEMAEGLAKINVNDAILQMFVDRFIALPPSEAAVASDRVKENHAQAQAAFKGIYLNSPTTEGHRGNGLGLVDTAVEYLDHVRGARSDFTYVNRTLLQPEPLKAKAVKLVRELANA